MTSPETPAQGWEREFFDETYWALHRAQSDAEADGAAARLASALGLKEPKGRHGFDQGCGGGELARAFARRGAAVTAFDASPEMVAVARRTGTEAIVADARDGVPGSNGYDFGYNYGSGIGYGTLDDALAFFERAAEALKPGAHFAVETLNARRILREPQSVLAYECKHAITGGEWQVRRECRLDRPAEGPYGPVTMTQDWTMTGEGRKVTRRSQVKLISGSGLAALARLAGFAEVEIIDDQTLGPVREDSDRLILRMRRMAWSERSDLARRCRDALRRAADGPAIIDGTPVSGRDALDAAILIAMAIVTRGGPGTPVAILTGRTWACPIAMVAARLAGRPFCILDPKMAETRLQGVLARLKPGAIVAMGQDADAVRRVHGRNGAKRTEWTACAIPGVQGDVDVAAYDGAASVAPLASHLCFTSGSTGEPKGVMLREEGLLATVDAQVALLGEVTGPSLWMLNPGFDASLSDMLCALLSGAPLRVHRPEPTRVKALAAALAESACCDIPPSMMAVIDPARTTLASAIFGGERAAPDTVKRWSRHVLALQAYGPTEASVCATMAVGGEHWRAGEIGRPIGASRIWIRQEDGTLVEITAEDPAALPEDGASFNAATAGGRRDGVKGEIMISGASLALGYLGDAEASLVRFPIIGGTRYHATGDIASLTGGRLIWAGRTDRQLKLNGRLVCPEEIEAVVARRFPGTEALCLMHGGRLKVALGCGSGGESEILAAIRNDLGPGMTPTAAISVGALPRNANGKIDQAAAAALLEGRRRDEAAFQENDA